MQGAREHRVSLGVSSKGLKAFLTCRFVLPLPLWFPMLGIYAWDGLE